MIDLIDRAKNILDNANNVALFPIGSQDNQAYQSALALYHSLKKLGKNVKLIDPANYDGDLAKDNSQKNFSITIDLTQKEIGEISYDKKDDLLKLDFEVLSGNITQDDVVFLSGVPNDFDAIITIGVQRLPDLEDVLDENFKLFYEKPIINIDNNVFNEKFGQVNLIKQGPIAKTIIILLNSFNKKLKKEREVLEALYKSALSFDDTEADEETKEDNQKLLAYLDSEIDQGMQIIPEQEQEDIRGQDHLEPEQQIEQENVETEPAEEETTDLPKEIQGQPAVVRPPADYGEARPETEEIIEEEPPKEELISGDEIIKKLKLFNKAIDSINPDEKSGIPIMTLRYNDFIEARSDVSDIALVIKEVQHHPIYRFTKFILMWEEKANGSLCGAVLYSNVEQQIVKIAQFYKAKHKLNAVLVYAHKNIDEFKQELNNLLWKK